MSHTGFAKKLNGRGRLLCYLRVILLLLSCLTNVEAGDVQGGLLRVISSEHTSDDELLTAIDGLGPVTESAAFWTRIANDSRYRDTYRRICIIQLFHRHIATPIGLRAFAEILDRPTWMMDDDIDIVSELAGVIPVNWTFEDTIFVVRVFPKLPGNPWAIYLRVSGKIGRASFLRMIRGEVIDEVVKDAIILELAISRPLTPRVHSSNRD